MSKIDVRGTISGDIARHELSATGAVFGRKSDLEVVFRGEGACTDGKVVFLPAINGNARVDHKTMRVMRGFLDHEAGHVRHTDMDHALEIYKKYAEAGDKLSKGVHNALEDMRLEKLVMEEYSGSVEMLAAVADYANEIFLKQLREGKWSREQLNDVRMLGPVAITWLGRYDYAGDSARQCFEATGPDVQRKVRAALAKLKDGMTTQDVTRITEEIVAEWRDGREPEREPGDDGRDPEGEPREPSDRGTDDEREREPRDDGKPSDDGEPDDDGDGEAEGEAEGEGEGEGEDARDDGRGEDEDKDEAPRDPNSEDKTDEASTFSPPEDAPEPVGGFDPTEIVEAAMREADLIGPDPGRWLVADTSRDCVFDVQNPPLVPFSLFAAKRCREYGSAKRYDKALADMRSDVGVIRRKLERALIAKQQRHWVGGLEQGRLDTKRMTAVVAGRQNVFKKRHDASDLDTVVSIVLDLSGSMNSGGRIIMARDCAIALSEALERTSVTYEVIGFQNIRDIDAVVGWDGVKGTNRHEYLDMPVFKGFDQKLARRKEAMSSIMYCAASNNSDADALRVVWHRLKMRDESRKVMLVLSDGAPCAAGSGHSDQLLRVVPEIVSEGCEIAAIGIQTESVAHFFPKWARVDRVSDLSGVALTVLSKQLLGERGAGDRAA